MPRKRVSASTAATCPAPSIADASLPAEQRYFGGEPPETLRFGSAWPGAHFNLIDQTAEVAPDIHLIALVSDRLGSLEMRELSLAINTPEGMVIVVGCSHPGIDTIIAAATAIHPRARLIVGGLHLLAADDREIATLIGTLQNQYRVEYVAPGHCTGEPAFAALKDAFGNRYLYAGLGTTLHSNGLPD